MKTAAPTNKRRPAARTLQAPARDPRLENEWRAKWAAAGIDIRRTICPVLS